MIIMVLIAQATMLTEKTHGVGIKIVFFTLLIKIAENFQLIDIRLS